MSNLLPAKAPDRAQLLICGQLNVPSGAMVTREGGKVKGSKNGKAKADAPRGVGMACLAAAVVMACLAVPGRGQGLDPCQEVGSGTLKRRDGMKIGMALVNKSLEWWEGIEDPCDDLVGKEGEGLLTATFVAKVDSLAVLRVNRTEFEGSFGGDQESNVTLALFRRGVMSEPRVAKREGAVAKRNGIAAVQEATIRMDTGTVTRILWADTGCSSCRSNSRCGQVAEGSLEVNKRNEEACMDRVSACDREQGPLANDSARCTPSVRLGFTGTDFARAPLESGQVFLQISPTQTLD